MRPAHPIERWATHSPHVTQPPPISVNAYFYSSLFITGSPAGLSRVNGVRRSSAETWNLNPSLKAQFFINWLQILREWLNSGGHQPRQSWFGSDVRSRRHVRSTYTGTVTYVFVFLFFNKATAHTREPILAHNSPKDAVWCKEDPFGNEKCVILKVRGVLP